MVRLKIFFMLLLATLALVWGTPAQADLTYIPITFDYNSYNWGRDANYPTGDVTLGGIPFSIPTSPNNNTWDSNIGTGTQVLVIPVNLSGVKEIHTLINTSWGYPGDQFTTLDFNWSGGLTVQVVLTDGVDIRDWWNGGYANSISPPTVQVYSGTGTPSPHLPTRIDKQLFIFDGPEYADRILESIVMTDNGWAGRHRAYLYGVTAGVDPAPIPGAAWLLGSGLIGLGSLRRFRKSY
jgi:hypothetical protein